MKLTKEQRRMIALGAGILLVVIGFLPDLSSYGIDKDTADTIILALVVLGGAALLSGRKRKGRDRQEGTDKIDQVNNIIGKNDTRDN